MLPVLFKIGPITIYSFGLFLALGFLIALFTIYREAKKEYLDEEKVFDVVFLTTIGGILGARIFYIIEHFDSFGFSVLNWFLVNARPGFSLWGGIGAGVAVFLLTSKNKKLPLYKLFDMITIGAVVSFIFGEFGSFMAGTKIGLPTKLPWGMVFYSTLKRHPVSLYEVLASIITLLILVKFKKAFVKKRVPSGNLFFTFIIIESFLLFLIAFFKEDVIVIGRIFQIDHFVYLTLFIAGSILLYRRLGRTIKNDFTLIKVKINKINFLKRGTREKIPG